MAKFVVVYAGGSMAQTPEAQEAAMKRWGDWFGTLGSAVTDHGNPFGASAGVQSDGTTSAAKAALTGYSIIEADGIEGAAKMASTCPVFDAGGSVEVYEAMPM